MTTLTEGKIIVQIGNAALWLQEIGDIHAGRSFHTLPDGSGGTVPLLVVLYKIEPSIS